MKGSANKMFDWYIVILVSVHVYVVNAFRDAKQEKLHSTTCDAAESMRNDTDYDFLPEQAKKSAVPGILKFLGSLKPLPKGFPDMEKVASGKHGTVFKATEKGVAPQKKSKRMIAVKKGPVADGVREWYVSRLLEETLGVENAAEGIVLTDETPYCIQGGSMYTIQPWMPLGTLEDAVNTSEPSVVIALLKDVGSTLASMHRHYIQHGDVKPANIVLTEIDGTTRAKLCDLGSAMVGNDKEFSKEAVKRDITRFGQTIFFAMTGDNWKIGPNDNPNFEVLVEKLKKGIADSGSGQMFKPVEKVMGEIQATLKKFYSIPSYDVPKLMKSMMKHFVSGSKGS